MRVAQWPGFIVIVMRFVLVMIMVGTAQLQRTSEMKIHFQVKRNQDDLGLPVSNDANAFP